MTDDELMDRLLRETMADKAPQLPPAFDGRVMARVRPRRLTPWGRALMTTYAILALAAIVWAASAVSLPLMAASTLVCALVAFAMSRYARAVALRSI